MRGTEVEALDLEGFEPVPEVQGLADQWLKRPGSYIAVFCGESLAFDGLGRRAAGFALVYEGLPSWA